MGGLMEPVWLWPGLRGATLGKGAPHMASSSGLRLEQAPAPHPGPLADLEMDPVAKILPEA